MGQTGGWGTLRTFPRPRRDQGAGLSLAAKARREFGRLPLSHSTFGPFLRESDPGGLPPGSRVTEKIRGAQTDPDIHTNTHTPRVFRRTGNTHTVQPHQPLNTGPLSHQEGPEVTEGQGGRGQERLAQETGNGRFSEGPSGRGRVQGRPVEAGSCFSPAGPTRGLQLGVERGLSGRASRPPNREGRTSSENCREFRAPWAHAWGLGPGHCEARPGRVWPRRSGLIGLVVPQGFPRGTGPSGIPKGERVGGRPGRRGRRELEAPRTLPATLAASLQPGRGRASGAALAGPRRRCPHLPASRAADPDRWAWQ